MTKNAYAEAAHKALESGSTVEQVLSGLQAVMLRHGRARLYPAVLKDLAARLAKAENARAVTVSVAREADAKKYAAEIEAFGSTVGASRVDVVVDESIIGGYIAETTTKRKDASYKESLAAIYRSLTA